MIAFKVIKSLNINTIKKEVSRKKWKFSGLAYRLTACSKQRAWRHKQSELLEQLMVLIIWSYKSLREPMSRHECWLTFTTAVLPVSKYYTLSTRSSQSAMLHLSSIRSMLFGDSKCYNQLLQFKTNKKRVMRYALHKILCEKNFQQT